MFQAFRDATVATRPRRRGSRPPRPPWYLEQTKREARAALTPEQREAQFQSYKRRFGTSSKNRG